MKGNWVPTLLDSHCHLDLPAFDDDLDTVLKRARHQQITRFHIPGTTVQGWQKQRLIASLHAGIDYSFGLHPYFLHAESYQDLSLLSHALNAGGCPVAVGEIGLDAVVDVPHELQIGLCEAQLNIAKESQLPVILHHRKTHHELLGLLKKVDFKLGGIVHAFSGSLDVAKAYADRGFALGVGGTITYPRSNKTRRALQGVDLSSLVLETDAPDMPVNGFQGQRNEPSRLIHVLDALAELLDTDRDEVARTTTDTYLRVLGLS